MLRIQPLDTPVASFAPGAGLRIQPLADLLGTLLPAPAGGFPPEAPPRLPPIAEAAAAPGGGEGGGGSPSGFGSAPSITAASPTSLAGMLTSAITGNTAPTTAQTVPAHLGLLALSMLGVPMSPITAPVLALGHLSQLAHRFGLTGQDTSGMMGLSQGAIDAALGIAQGSGPNVAAAIAQGLGLTAGQLASLTLNATFGRGIDANDPSGPTGPTGPTGPSGGMGGNDPTGLGLGDAPGAGVGPASGDAGSGGAPGGSAGAPSGGGDSGNAGDFHTGGPVRKGPPKGPNLRATLLEGEYVIRKASAKAYAPLLRAINAGEPPHVVSAVAKAVAGEHQKSLKESRAGAA